MLPERLVLLGSLPTSATNDVGLGKRLPACKKKWLAAFDDSEPFGKNDTVDIR
jgi:hypothetical protein